MVNIKHGENGKSVITGENLSPGECWRGIGDLWNGYSALLTDVIYGTELILCGDKNDNSNSVVDIELYNLNSAEREILCLYYGLMYHKKCNTMQIVLSMNSRSYVWERCFIDSEIENIREASLEKLRSKPISDYIYELTGRRYF